MFYVIESYTGEVLFTAHDEESCRKFCGQIAYAENYGLCRSWRHDGHLCMDCGPRTFIITDNPSGLNPKDML